MPFVVAAPAAVIGAIGGFMALFGAEPGYFSGILFGLGAAILLAATGKAPVERVGPPPWSRTILIGLCCTAALFSIGWSAVGFGGWATALVGGAACAIADRRTMLNKSTRNLHRVLSIAAILAAAESVVTQPILGLAALTGAGAGLLFPVDLLTRRPRLRIGSAHSISGGYGNEVLAIAAFLDATDIPKALVTAAANEVGAGRASSLRTLAIGALLDVGPDSWQARPMVQEFARKRMLAEERKAWAARAVRMLTLNFPQAPKAGDELCERLVPHALAAVGYAEALDVERGPAAVLLDRVATYLAAMGRLEEAQTARKRAIAHASAGFGEASAEVATLHSHLVRGRSAASSAASSWPSSGASSVASSASSAASSAPPSEPAGPGVVGSSVPSVVPVGVDLSSLSTEDGYSGRSALAFSFAQTGNVRLEAGDVAGARRDYRAALNNARFSLPRNHPLVAEVRARLAALPQPARDEDNEKRLVVGCFALVVATVLICVGFTVVRDLSESRSKASDKELRTVDQLVDVCNSNQRYFRDAAAFAGPEPHPAQVFRRDSNDTAFRRELFGVDVDPRKNQLVACALQTRTGPPIATCKFTTQPEIPLHEAIYQITVYETLTGRRLGAQAVTANKGQCPISYTPPPQGKPWMLYAAPSDDQYRQALQPVLDLLPFALPASASAH
ncbi:MAG TPA: hypothetical protein VFC19_52150 [Candidatus Limnocylindrales bacterium]|nr:hypothetical protein [Candidatus Limnocylindrales bacterium]